MSNIPGILGRIVIKEVTDAAKDKGEQIVMDEIDPNDMLNLKDETPADHITEVDSSASSGSRDVRKLDSTSPPKLTAETTTNERDGYNDSYVRQERSRTRAQPGDQQLGAYFVSGVRVKAFYQRGLPNYTLHLIGELIYE